MKSIAKENKFFGSNNSQRTGHGKQRRRLSKAKTSSSSNVTDQVEGAQR
jgi:hypothetical protein